MYKQYMPEDFREEQKCWNYWRMIHKGYGTHVRPEKVGEHRWALEAVKGDNLASMASSCQHPPNTASDTPVDLYHWLAGFAQTIPLACSALFWL